MPSDELPPARRDTASDPALERGSGEPPSQAEVNDLRLRVLRLEKLPGKIALVEATLQETTSRLEATIANSVQKLDMAKQEVGRSADESKAMRLVLERASAVMESQHKSMEVAQKAQANRSIWGQVISGGAALLLQSVLLFRLLSPSATTPPPAHSAPIVVYLPAPSFSVSIPTPPPSAVQSASVAPSSSSKPPWRPPHGR